MTPSLSPPSTIAGFVETCVRIPILCASEAIFLVPTFSPTSANTELSDLMSASASVEEPEYELS